MRVLLDTNVLIWATATPERLSADALAIVMDPAETRLISPLSTYEIAQKIAVGKLQVGEPATSFVAAASLRLELEWLPLTHRHLEAIDRVPWTHRDPFDRLLALQALVEDIAIMSPDQRFDELGVRRLW